MMLALVPPMAVQERVATATHDDDRTLAQRVVSGERAALVHLYRTHQHRVRAFAIRVLGSEAAADDLVHEMFLALPKVLGNFRGEASLASFLIGVAARRAQHHVRARLRRVRAEESSMTREPPPSSPNPERAVQRRELADQLATALEALPLDQRIAFVMCEVEGRTSVEVAALLEENDGTVRARVHLAKKKLRAALREVAQ